MLLITLSKMHNKKMQVKSFISKPISHNSEQEIIFMCINVECYLYTRQM